MPNLRQKIHGHLGKVAKTLATCQNAEGYFEPSWFERISGDDVFSRMFKATIEAKLRVTGHHLEWLLLTPSEIRPPPDILRNAATWAYRVLEKNSKDTDWLMANYCSASHAAKSLIVLAMPEKRFADPETYP